MGLDVPPDDTPPAPPRCPHCHDAGWVKRAGPIRGGGTSLAGSSRQVSDAQALLVKCGCRVARERTAPAALLERSGLPARQRDWTFAAFRPMDEEKHTGSVLVAAAVDEVAAGKAVNLKLNGGTGTGKSHLASAFTRALVDQGIAVLYVYAPDMLDTIREAYGEGDNAAARYFGALLQHPVLVLDDIAADKVSEWAEGRLTALVHERLHAERTTVVTTDLGDEAMVGKLGARITSRLREYQQVHLGTLDMRGVR